MDFDSQNFSFGQEDVLAFKGNLDQASEGLSQEAKNVLRDFVSFLDGQDALFTEEDRVKLLQNFKSEQDAPRDLLARYLLYKGSVKSGNKSKLEDGQDIYQVEEIFISEPNQVKPLFLDPLRLDTPAGNVIFQDLVRSIGPQQNKLQGINFNYSQKIAQDQQYIVELTNDVGNATSQLSSLINQNKQTIIEIPTGEEISQQSPEDINKQATVIDQILKVKNEIAQKVDKTNNAIVDSGFISTQQGVQDLKLKQGGRIAGIVERDTGIKFDVLMEQIKYFQNHIDELTKIINKQLDQNISLQNQIVTETKEQTNIVKDYTERIIKDKEKQGDVFIELGAYKSQALIYQKQLDELKQQMQVQANAANQNQQQVAYLQAQLSKITGESQELNKFKEVALQRIQTYEQQQSNAQQNYNQTLAENQQMRQQLAVLEQQKQAYIQQDSQTQARILSSEQNLKEINERYNVISLQNIQLQKEYDNIKGQSATEQQQKNNLEQQMAQQQQQLQQLTNQSNQTISDLQKDNQQLRQNKQNLELTIAQYQQKVEQIQNDSQKQIKEQTAQANSQLAAQQLEYQKYLEQLQAEISQQKQIQQQLAQKALSSETDAQNVIILQQQLVQKDTEMKQALQQQQITEQEYQKFKNEQQEAVTALNQSLKTLQQINQQSEQQIHETDKYIENYLKQIEQGQQSQNVAQQQITENNNFLKSLATKVGQIKQVYDQKLQKITDEKKALDDELQKYKQRFLQFQAEQDQYRQNLNKDQSATLEEKQKHILEIQQRYQQEVNILKQAEQQYQTKIQQLEQQYQTKIQQSQADKAQQEQLYQQNLSKVNQEKQTLENQIQQQKQQQLEIKNQYENQLQQLKNDNDLSNQEKQQIQQQLKQQYTVEQQQSQQKISQLQQSLQQQYQLNSTIQQQNKQRINELTEEYQSELSRLKQEKDALQTKIQNTFIDNQEKGMPIAQQKEVMDQMEQKYKSLQMEEQSLKQQFQEVKSQLDKQQLQNVQLEEHNKVQQVQLQQNNETIQDYKKKLQEQKVQLERALKMQENVNSDLQKEYKIAVKEVQENKNKIAMEIKNQYDNVQKQPESSQKNQEKMQLEQSSIQSTKKHDAVKEQVDKLYNSEFNANNEVYKELKDMLLETNKQLRSNDESTLKNQLERNAQYIADAQKLQELYYAKSDEMFKERLSTLGQVGTVISDFSKQIFEQSSTYATTLRTRDEEIRRAQQTEVDNTRKRYIEEADKARTDFLEKEKAFKDADLKRALEQIEAQQRQLKDQEIKLEQKKQASREKFERKIAEQKIVLEQKLQSDQISLKEKADLQKQLFESQARTTQMQKEYELQLKLEGEKATRTILEKSDNLEKEKLNIIKTYIEKGGKNTNDLNNGLNYNNNNNNNQIRQSFGGGGLGSSLFSQNYNNNSGLFSNYQSTQQNGLSYRQSGGPQVVSGDDGLKGLVQQLFPKQQERFSQGTFSGPQPQIARPTAQSQHVQNRYQNTVQYQNNYSNPQNLQLKSFNPVQAQQAGQQFSYSAQNMNNRFGGLAQQPFPSNRSEVAQQRDTPARLSYNTQNTFKQGVQNFMNRDPNYRRQALNQFKTAIPQVKKLNINDLSDPNSDAQRARFQNDAFKSRMANKQNIKQDQFKSRFNNINGGWLQNATGGPRSTQMALGFKM